MRILDEDTNKACKNVTLFLTDAEARELRDTIEGLLDDGVDSHGHVPNEDFTKEITVCIYDTKALGSFSERAKKLIEFDE